MLTLAEILTREIEAELVLLNWNLRRGHITREKCCQLAYGIFRKALEERKVTPTDTVIDVIVPGMVLQTAIDRKWIPYPPPPRFRRPTLIRSSYIEDTLPDQGPVRLPDLIRDRKINDIEVDSEFEYEFLEVFLGGCREEWRISALKAGKPDRSALVRNVDRPRIADESRNAKKPLRRNARYEGIDRALREISEARPKNHEEVFQFLDDRKVPVPNRKPFKVAGGWVKAFQQNRHSASAWLSQAWGRLGLPAFARGPKK
jgi:hypothetical protein